MRKKTTSKKATPRKKSAKKTSVKKTHLTSPPPRKTAVSNPKTDESIISKIMSVVDDAAAKIKTVLPGTA